jgi:hypothetical protein
MVHANAPVADTVEHSRRASDQMPIHESRNVSTYQEMGLAGEWNSNSKSL